MLFDGWWGLARVIIVGAIGYTALLVFLRISGKRTLSKLNAFDLVITIALGSTLSTLIVSRSTPILEGVLALAVLIGCQFVIAWFQVRHRRFETLVKSEPTMLFYRGQFRYAAMRRERVTEEEIKAAIRNGGGTSVEDTFAVVLETDGSLVAVAVSTDGTSALAHVRGLGDQEQLPRTKAA